MSPAWERPTAPMPGDVGLTRGKGKIAWAIRWAEARRYGKGSEEAKWNHAFMVVSESGAIVEATGKGVGFSSFFDYDTSPLLLLRPPYATEGNRERSIQEMRSKVGDHYGYLTDVSLALAFVFQTRLRFGMSGEYICSGAVSHALDSGGVDMGDDSSWNSPADVLHIAQGG